MILHFTFLMGTLSFLYYKSQKEANFKGKESLDFKSDSLDDDLYKDLEDLFI